jgi:hypothetical protein
MQSYTQPPTLSNHSADYLYLKLQQIFPQGAGQISHDHLAKLIGKCRRTVIRLCDILEKTGYITITRAPRNSKIPNIYTLTQNVTQLENVTQLDEANHEKCHTEDSVVHIEDSVYSFFPGWGHIKDSEFYPDYYLVPRISKQQVRSDIDADLQRDIDANLPGLEPRTLSYLVKKYKPERITAAIRLMLDQPRIFNPPGWVIWALNHWDNLIPARYDLAGNCLGELQ